MIDNIPQANLTVAPFAAPAVNATGTTAGTENSGQLAGGSQPQEPFASALQNRLQQLLAGSKTTARAGSAVGQAHASGDTQTQRLYATLATHMRGQTPSETAANANIPDASATGAVRDLLASLADTKPSLQADSNDADSAGTLISATETPPPPLAANLPFSPAQSQAPIPGNDLTKGAQTLHAPAHRDTAQPGSNLTAAADAATDVATFAASAEKNGAGNAAPAESGKDNTFALLLKNADASGVHPTSMAGAPPAPGTLTTTPMREVSTPLTSSAWGQDVGNQISWMINQRESRAELVLNPPALGRIEVSITLNGDQASASFVSANPEVRDALQGSLPRLREVLADAGVFLGQADIGSRSSGQGGNDAEKGRNSPGDSFASAAKTLLGSTNDFVQAGSSSTIARGRGLIDLFA